MAFASLDFYHCHPYLQLLHFLVFHHHLLRFVVVLHHLLPFVLLLHHLLVHLVLPFVVVLHHHLVHFVLVLHYIINISIGVTKNKDKIHIRSKPFLSEGHLLLLCPCWWQCPHFGMTPFLVTVCFPSFSVAHIFLFTFGLPGIRLRLGGKIVWHSEVGHMSVPLIGLMLYL